MNFKAIQLRRKGKMVFYERHLGGVNWQKTIETGVHIIF